MTRRGPRRRSRGNGGEAFEETARDGSTYRLRLVGHDEQAYDWYYNVVANPMLWFLQHYLWDLATAPTSTTACTTRGSRDTCRSTRASPGPCSTSSSASPTRPSSSTTITSMLRRGSCATRGRMRGSRTSSTSRGRSRTTGGAAASRCGARCTTACSRTTSSASTRAAGGATSCARREDIVGAVLDWARDTVGYDGRAIAVTAPPISVDPAEFDELARQPGRARAGRKLAQTGPRRSCCASTARIRRRTSCAASAPSSSTSTRTRRCTGASACSRCSTRRVRRSPSTPSMSAAIQREARRVNDRFQQDGWVPIDLQISDNFPRASPPTRTSTCCS